MEPTLEALKAIIVEAADQELVPAFATAAREVKTDGSIVTAADKAMQARIRSTLAQRWPAYRFLGEEMDEAEQRALIALRDHGYWCLDPVDGTSNFAYGIPFFSVSLALIHHGEVQMGLVYDPVRRECFTAQRGQGAYLNGQRLAPRRYGISLSQCIGLIDFKRLSEPLAARLVTQRPYGSQRSFGSVALDWCWIAAGRCHIYLHGKQRLWDYAAGSLILAETGGRAVTLDGEAVFKESLAARSAVAALDEELFAAWADYLGIPV